jgi:hypothetical protein
MLGVPLLCRPVPVDVSRSESEWINGWTGSEDCTYIGTW